MRSGLFKQLPSVLILFLGFCLASGAAHAGRRVALLIGNSNYSVRPLAGPVRDVAAMKETLTAAGFDIIQARTDLDQKGMNKALQSFQDAVQGAEIGLVFYSGHGMEFGGENYLIPIDAHIASDRDVTFETIPLNLVLRALDGATKLKLVLLDACRDNPFVNNMQRAATRGSVSRGLGRMESPFENMLIAFAAAPGQVAYDGDGGTSPFTSALVKRLTTPGLEVEMALRMVRDDVMQDTHRRQQPYKTGSVGGESIFLNANVPAANSSAALPATSDTATRADYEAARAAGTIAVWDAFLRKYPSGFYSELAKTEREKLARSYAGRCDELAASPYDPQKPADLKGVPIGKISPVEATSVCRLALADRPNDSRMKANLARAFLAQENYKEAAEFSRQAADAGNSVAMTNLGLMYTIGLGVTRDDAEAVKFYRKAMDAGDADAMTGLGFMYERGHGVARDDVEAARLYRKAADAGDTDAMVNLGVRYEQGLGVTLDYVESVKLYRKAADAGSSIATFFLGNMYALGQGVTRDDTEAVKLYRKAADAGISHAMYNLGNMYAHGRGVARDDAEAAKLYRKGADTGDADATYSLGYMYQHGLGVVHDDAEAVKLYRKAADAGNRMAMYNLGVMYALGQGVPRDDSAAVKFYRKPADAGDADAMNNLGYMYEQGRGVTRDDTEAVKLYRKAADAGNANAMYNLGRMYKRGLGVRQDTKEARKWFKKAADMGLSAAREAL